MSPAGSCLSEPGGVPVASLFVFGLDAGEERLCVLQTNPGVAPKPGLRTLVRES